MTDTKRCEVCGEPMAAGEEMFRFHGYSGDCPKPPLAGYDAREELCKLIKLAKAYRTVDYESLEFLSTMQETAIL